MTDHADGRSGAMLHSIAVEDPATVAVDARAGRVVVMNQDGSVSVLDARTDAPLHGTLVSSAPGWAVAVDALLVPHQSPHDGGYVTPAANHGAVR
jgi:DNA-binding beta-propeller fold protein YncE